jgi:hypothetical protein
MNIELDEVVVQDVSDDELEQAAGGAHAGGTLNSYPLPSCCTWC